MWGFIFLFARMETVGMTGNSAGGDKGGRWWAVGRVWGHRRRVRGKEVT